LEKEDGREGGRRVWRNNVGMDDIYREREDE